MLKNSIKIKIDYLTHVTIKAAFSCALLILQRQLGHRLLQWIQMKAAMPFVQVFNKLSLNLIGCQLTADFWWMNVYGQFSSRC